MAINDNMSLLHLIEGQGILEECIPSFKPYVDVTDLEHAQHTFKEIREDLQHDLDNSTQGGETRPSALAYNVQERLTKHQQQLAEIDQVD